MSRRAIRLSATARHRVAELAALAYPDEGCGVLIGSVDAAAFSAVAATSGTNLNRERARDRYLLDPGDIVRADRQARTMGLDVVGFWHSHPDHPAWPSQFDTDHAWADYAYLIVSTTAAGAGDLNGFTLTADGGTFEQLPLIEAADFEPSP